MINTSFSSLLPTFPIMYVQVHLSKHTSSCINLHQHSFSSFTLFHSILSYPSLHSIDYQLHQKDPDFPAEVHILNFFWSLSRKNFHQLTLQTCSILKWQKYPNSGKLLVCCIESGCQTTKYTLQINLCSKTVFLLNAHLLKLCSAYHIPYLVYHHQKRYPGIWNI